MRDSQGETVRRVEGPATAGFHRVAWDLRYPASHAWSGQEGGGGLFARQGVLAAPGRYTVSLAKRMDGVTTELDQEQGFEVVPLWQTVPPRMEPAKMVETLRRVDRLAGTVSAASAAVSEADERLEAIHQALARSTADTVLRDEASGLKKRLYDLRLQLDGDRLRGRMGIPTLPSIAGRIGMIQMGNRFSTYGPTEHHLHNFGLASSAWDDLRPQLRQLISEELPALELKLQAAGVPWTPGRPVP